jgi:hypothetical protein
MEPHHMNGSLGKPAPTHTPAAQAAASALAPGHWAWDTVGLDWAPRKS